MVISLPAAFRNAFVHRTFRGLRFILGQSQNGRGCHPGVRSYLKFLLHLAGEYSDPFSKRRNAGARLTLSCKTGRPSHRSGQMRFLQTGSGNHNLIPRSQNVPCPGYTLLEQK